LLKDETFKGISAIVKLWRSQKMFWFIMANITIFQLLPDVYDMLLGVTNYIVIVISAHEWPRHFCMHDTRPFCATLCYGDGSDIKLPLDRHENHTYKLFYMHTEMCVYDKKIQAFFNCTHKFLF
jgi:hypothetical protein